MPDGIPKYIRAYDNGGGYKYFCMECYNFTDEDDCCNPRRKLRPAAKGTADRYTVVFTGKYAGKSAVVYLGMNPAPFHPMGIGLHGESDTYFDKGKAGFSVGFGGLAPFGEGNRRIPFSVLPKDCQTLVISTYKDLWGL